jgi:DNA-binding NarL/FixJ family response regulator
MTGEAPLRVLTVDDHPLLRQGIAAIIENEPDKVLVSQGSTGTEAIQHHREQSLNLVCCGPSRPR